MFDTDFEIFVFCMLTTILALNASNLIKKKLKTAAQKSPDSVNQELHNEETTVPAAALSARSTTLEEVVLSRL
jgi:hypothetical protein